MSEFAKQLRKSFFRRTAFFVTLFTFVFLITLPFIVYFVEITNYKSKLVKIVEKLVNHEIAPFIDKNGVLVGNIKDIEDSISDLVLYGDVLDFRIWKKDTIIYSYSNKTMEGRKYLNEDLMKVYNDKKTFIEFTKPYKEENNYLKDYGRLVETYYPITENNKILAVAEFYTEAPSFYFFGPQSVIVFFIAITIPFAIYIILYTQFKKTITILSEYDIKLQESHTNLWKSYFNSIKCLAKALEMKDIETEGHSERVVLISLYIANKLKLNNNIVSQLVIGAYLHDIGKISVPDSILLKESKLNMLEKKIVEKHVLRGYEVMKDDDVLSIAKDLVLYHHEKWDGTGYLKGLKGEEIPLIARIFSIADVFDALMSKRPYKKSFFFDEAMEIIKEYSNKFFDSELVNIFCTISEDEYTTLIKEADAIKIHEVINDAIIKLLKDEVSNNPQNAHNAGNSGHRLGRFHLNSAIFPK